jgi:hypothetical protein
MMAVFVLSQTGEGQRADEGVFLACSFWLADNYVSQHQPVGAEALLKTLRALRNGARLLCEEYDTKRKLLLGDRSRVQTHVSFRNSILNLIQQQGNAD